jgi:large subunit ribosomal protein L10
MPAQSKYDMLAKVKASFEASTGFFVINYRLPFNENNETVFHGLTVKDSQELRRALREVGGSMKVYKNNIVKIALEEAGLPTMDETLVGTCAYVFFGSDPVSVAKVLREYAKKSKKIEVIGGIADGVALNAEEAKAYADLPSYEELIGQIAGLISGFARGLAVAINEIPGGLARTINAVSEQKQAA